MKEKTLEKIAVSIAILGILTIIYASEIIKLETIDIDQINKDSIELKVQIEGQITKITSTPSVTILEIKDSTDSIKAAILEKVVLEFEEGQKVIVVGKVEEYNGELEIIVEEISSSQNVA